MLASNRVYHDMQARRIGYWAVRSNDGDRSNLVATAALNTGKAPLELARLAFERGQTETARLLYAQVKRLGAEEVDPELEKLITIAKRGGPWIAGSEFAPTRHLAQS